MSSLPRGGDQSPILSSGLRPFDQRGLEDGRNCGQEFFTWKFLRVLLLENFNSFPGSTLGAHTRLPLSSCTASKDAHSTPYPKRLIFVNQTPRGPTKHKKERLSTSRDLVTYFVMHLPLCLLLYLCSPWTSSSTRPGTGWAPLFTNAQDLAQC